MQFRAGLPGRTQVSSVSPTGAGREAINDCSGVVEYKGVYHVFHQVSRMLHSVRQCSSLPLRSKPEPGTCRP
jgi:hypothetical protein